MNAYHRVRVKNPVSMGRLIFGSLRPWLASFAPCSCDVLAELFGPMHFHKTHYVIMM